MRSSPIKLLHITPSFAPAWSHGGPVEAVDQLCRHLSAAGCDVRVLTTDCDGPDQILAVEKRRPVEITTNLQVRYCPRRWRLSVSPVLLRSLLSSVRWAHVVHLTAVYNFPTFPTLHACRILHKPLVWSPRGALQRWKDTRRQTLKALWESACSAIAPNGTLLHVTSDAERIDSSRRLPRLRTVVIPNGVEVPHEALHIDGDGELRLVYLGRLEPKKGLENLLLACRTLVDTGLSFSLVIGGSGDAKYTEALKARVAQLSLASRVAFLGHVPRDAKGEFFAKADVAVVPSHVENFCAVIAEALAHEVPVVASRGTPWHRVEQMGCGLWVDNAPESLAAAIRKIGEMPLREMGERGRQWMIAEYCWPAIAQQMLGVYSSLISQDVAGESAVVSAAAGTSPSVVRVSEYSVLNGRR
jgi:glycosyltransferase involved in cell wall biosynthesis